VNEANFRKAEQRLWASLGVTPSERNVRLEHSGTSLRVQEVGDGSPLLFIHGGSNSGSSWAPLVARLTGFRCILPDRPGCGLSEPLAAPFDTVAAFDAFADTFVADLLDALQLDRAHLAATSFGGYLALRAAAAQPSRVGRMIEFGWPIGAPVGRTPFSMRVTAVPGLGRLLASIPASERSVRAILKNIGMRHALEEGEFTPEAIECFRSLLADTNTMRNELRAGPRVIHPIRGFNREIELPANLLSSIAAPLYFLWGEDDYYGGRDVARAFSGHFLNATLEILPGAGHAVWMDDADHAAAVTRHFLSA
jgi:pimeloyl-ACP methyl ester carboxylesterase